MSTFDDIKRAIASDLANKDSNTPASTTIITAADGVRVTSTAVGTVVSLPGSEKIVLDGSTFQFMECEALVQGKIKQRYCIVEKGVVAKYGNQYINSKGERIHILTHDAWSLLLSVVASAGKQIRDLSNDLRRTEEQRDVFKLTINALRKNGIID